MPTYTYACKTCGKEKDFTLPMKHKEPTHKEIDCEEEWPQTTEPLQRVFIAPGIQFKGAGWTETSSQTNEKNQKLKKLWNDSKVGNNPNPMTDNIK